MANMNQQSETTRTSEDELDEEELVLHRRRVIVPENEETFEEELRIEQTSNLSNSNSQANPNNSVQQPVREAANENPNSNETVPSLSSNSNISTSNLPPTQENLNIGPLEHSISASSLNSTADLIAHRSTNEVERNEQIFVRRDWSPRTFCSAIVILLLICSFFLFCVTSTLICTDIGCDEYNPPATWVGFGPIVLPLLYLFLVTMSQMRRINDERILFYLALVFALFSLFAVIPGFVYFELSDVSLSSVNRTMVITTASVIGSTFIFCFIFFCIEAEFRKIPATQLNSYILTGIQHGDTPNWPTRTWVLVANVIFMTLGFIALLVSSSTPQFTCSGDPVTCAPSPYDRTIWIATITISPFALIHIFFHMCLFRMRIDQRAFELCVAIVALNFFGIIPSFVFLIFVWTTQWELVAGAVILMNCGFGGGILFAGMEAEYRKRRLFTMYSPWSAGHLLTDHQPQQWKHRFSLLVILLISMLGNFIFFFLSLVLPANCNKRPDAYICQYDAPQSNSWSIFAFPLILFMCIHMSLVGGLIFGRNEKSLFDRAVTLCVFDALGFIGSLAFLILTSDILFPLSIPTGFSLVFSFLAGCVLGIKESIFRKRRFYPLHPSLFHGDYSVFINPPSDPDDLSNISPPGYQHEETSEMAPKYLIPVWVSSPLGLQVFLEMDPNLPVANLIEEALKELPIPPGVTKENLEVLYEGQPIPSNSSISFIQPQSKLVLQVRK